MEWEKIRYSREPNSLWLNIPSIWKSYRIIGSRMKRLNKYQIITAIFLLVTIGFPQAQGETVSDFDCNEYTAGNSCCFGVRPELPLVVCKHANPQRAGERHEHRFRHIAHTGPAAVRRYDWRRGERRCMGVLFRGWYRQRGTHPRHNSEFVGARTKGWQRADYLSSS